MHKQFQVMITQLISLIKKYEHNECTWTKWLSNTWAIHITWCTEESVGGWLLSGKNVMLCCKDNDTWITLYLDAMTYPMLVISIHLSIVTCMNQLYRLHLCKLDLKKKKTKHKLHTMDNPSTCRDIFNFTNLSMPPKRLMYSYGLYNLYKSYKLCNPYKSYGLCNS